MTRWRPWSQRSTNTNLILAQFVIVFAFMSIDLFMSDVESYLLSAWP